MKAVCSWDVKLPVVDENCRSWIAKLPFVDESCCVDVKLPFHG